MSRSKSIFKQSDVTKILKSFRDVGLPTPTIVVEPQRLTITPTELAIEEEANQWDA